MSSQRVWTASARSQETPEEREACLTVGREALGLSCESKTFTGRDTSLNYHRVWTAIARSQEIPKER